MTVRDLLRRVGGSGGGDAGRGVRAPAATDDAGTRADGVLRETADRMAELSRTVRALSRQVAQLRGLVHQQADFTVEALHRAGWQTDDEAASQAALQRTLRSIERGGDVIVGPWTGEVGFELLYWIPFLGWLAEQGLAGERMVVVSRGGAAPWYRHLTTRYVDLLDLMTPAEFRERTAGPKKQVEHRRQFDQDVVKTVAERLGLSDAGAVHPSVMFRLFSGLWRKRATVDLVDAFTSFRALTLPPDAGTDRAADAGLPADYIVAKFYFSKAFPDNDANRRFVADLLGRLSRQVPVALLSTSVRLDEHADFQAAGGSGLFVVDAHRVPQQNLARQTRLIAGARGFVGTYGGFSYLAPFHGVRSLSFFSRRGGFESHHLELAERVFDRLLPGGFAALDRHAADLVEPALDRWATRPSTADTPA